MPVCKFWLENRCRYGAACRFEHTKDGSQGNMFGTNSNWQGGGGGGGQRVSFQNNFNFQNKNGNQYRWSAANQNKGQEGTLGSALDVVSGLPEEMKRWEESKMWPFSCVSVEKDLPSLPDFQDLSVEEMRFEAYQCKVQGSMEPYIKKYQALASEFQNKRRQLQHMTMDLKEKLVKFVEEARAKKSSQLSPSGSGFSTQSSPLQPGSSSSGLFGKPQTFGGISQSPGQPASNVFGGSASQGSLFGGSSASSPSSSSVFSNNKFAVLASGSTFGGSAASSNSSSGGGGTLFGKPVAGSSSGVSGGGGVFGAGNQNNNQQTSLLGPVPSAPPGLFSQPAAQPGSGLFGSGSTTGQISGPGVFGGGSGMTGNTPSQPIPSLFGSTPAPSSQPATPNLFSTSGAATPQTSLLGPIPGSQPPSLFGKSINPTAVSAQPPGQGMSPGVPNLFGKPSPGFGVSSNQGQLGGGSSGGGLFGKGPLSTGGNDITSVESSTLYTPLSDLTESEKAAFEAKAFELGKIPIRPPPKELVHVK